MEGQAWWEWLLYTGSSAAGASALASALASSELAQYSGPALTGLEVLRLG